MTSMVYGVYVNMVCIIIYIYIYYTYNMCNYI